MKNEVVLFTKPEELISWLDENDILMGLESGDAKVLLDYMEGHGYGIGCKPEGKMIRKDLCEEDGEIEEYSIDDVIDAVCEWNYELILEIDIERRRSGSLIDFSNTQSKYENLKAEEKLLDRMFDKTKYGKEIEELAIRLAEEVIQNMKQGKEREAISIVSDGVKHYQTDKKGMVR